MEIIVENKIDPREHRTVKISCSQRKLHKESRWSFNERQQRHRRPSNKLHKEAKGHVFYTKSFILLSWWVKFLEQHKFPSRILKFSALLPRKWRCVCICLEIAQMHVRNGPSSLHCQTVHNPATGSCGGLHLQEEGTCRQYWEGTRGGGKDIFGNRMSGSALNGINKSDSSLLNMDI